MEASNAASDYFDASNSMNNTSFMQRMAEDHKCQLFFAKCDLECSEEEIKDYFKEFGEIQKIKLIKDNNTKKFKGFGFLSFPDSTCVDNIQKKRPHVLRGRQLDTRRVFGQEGSHKPEIAARVDKIYFGGIKDKNLNKQILQDYFTAAYGAPDNITYTSPRLDAMQNSKNGFAFVTYLDTDVCDKIVLDNPHIINDVQYTLRKGLKKEELPHLMNTIGNFTPQIMFAAGNDLSGQQVYPHAMAVPYSFNQAKSNQVLAKVPNNPQIDQMGYNQIISSPGQPQMATSAYPYQAAQPQQQFQQPYQMNAKLGSIPNYYQQALAVTGQYYGMVPQSNPAAVMKGGMTYPSAEGYSALPVAAISQQAPLPNITSPATNPMQYSAVASVPKYPVSATLSNATQPSTVVASANSPATNVKQLKVSQVLPQMQVNSYYN